jgi:hypothetical protein
VGPEPLDAALLDLGLRGESGAAEALQARWVPVVVPSGSPNGGMPPGPLTAVPRLHKPYRPDVLLREVAAAAHVTAVLDCGEHIQGSFAN